MSLPSNISYQYRETGSRIEVYLTITGIWGISGIEWNEVGGMVLSHNTKSVESGCLSKLDRSLCVIFDPL